MLLNDSESRIFEQINTKDTPYYGINRVIDGDAEELEEMPAPQKVYVLTKSVLLSSPYAIYAFDEHTVVIPIHVISELEDVSKKPGEAGRNAQEVLRAIDELNNFSKKQNKKSDIHHGIELPNGGMFFVATSDSKTSIEAAKACKRRCPSSTDVILVTNSLTQRILAEENDIIAEPYRSDSVDADEAPYTGRTETYCCDTDIEVSGVPNEMPISATTDNDKYVENEFVVVKRPDESTLGVYQVKGKKLVCLNMDNMHPYGVKPRNLGQKLAIHALQDGVDSSALTILIGPAGTAKTFMSLACGLAQTVDDDTYRNILVVRPNVKFDETVGFLKGSEAQKINPLIRPIMDNLDQLTSIKADKDSEYGSRSGKKGKFTTPDESEDKIVAPNSYAQYLFDSGKIVAQAMEYMRGRCIKNQYIIIDEAQNMSALQAFGIISRAGEGTKIILAGDPEQVDNPFLDAKTNGLSYAAKMMRGSRVCTQITFSEEECERSELAKEAIARMSPKGKKR